MDLKVNVKQGMFFEINIDNLGEFKFLFSENENPKENEKKFFLEAFWNPPQYGLVDFIVGYYVEDIQKEMEIITEDMSYFIDGARVACLCRIESGHDDEGVYEGILDMWFRNSDKEENSFCGYDGDVSELDCTDRECDGCEFYKDDNDDTYEIVTTDYFDNNYGWYGYPEFARNVLYLCNNKDEYGLVGKITLIDVEPSKRIYFKNKNGDDFTIRYNICDQDKNGWKASYTLYKMVKDKDGSHGEEISKGIAKAKYVNVNNGE